MTVRIMYEIPKKRYRKLFKLLLNYKEKVKFKSN